MIRHNRWAALPGIVAAMAMTALPVHAQSYYSQSTAIISRSTETHGGGSTGMSRYTRAQALHRRAVALAHEATVAAQNGHPHRSAQLAAQAQVLFNRSFRLTHPGAYAHQNGM